MRELLKLGNLTLADKEIKKFEVDLNQELEAIQQDLVKKVTYREFDDTFLTGKVKIFEDQINFLVDEVSKTKSDLKKLEFRISEEKIQVEPLNKELLIMKLVDRICFGSFTFIRKGKIEEVIRKTIMEFTAKEE